MIARSRLRQALSQINHPRGEFQKALFKIVVALNFLSLRQCANLKRNLDVGLDVRCSMFVQSLLEIFQFPETIIRCYENHSSLFVRSSSSAAPFLTLGFAGFALSDRGPPGRANFRARGPADRRKA